MSSSADSRFTLNAGPSAEQHPLPCTGRATGHPARASAYVFKGTYSLASRCCPRCVVDWTRLRPVSNAALFFFLFFSFYFDGNTKEAFVRAIHSYITAVAQGFCTALTLFHHHRPPLRGVEWHHPNPPDAWIAVSNASCFPWRWKELGAFETGTVVPLSNRCGVQSAPSIDRVQYPSSCPGMPSKYAMRPASLERECARAAGVG